MVDKKELPLDTAEQISHMKPAEQKTLADAIEKRAAKSPPRRKRSSSRKRAALVR